MQFEYVKIETDDGYRYRPCAPVTLSHGDRQFRVRSALFDTGADITILPGEIAVFLGVELDESRAIEIGAAGGGNFRALPSRNKIGFALQQAGFRPIVWSGVAYFSDTQPTILLGHKGCMEHLVLTFRGKERVMQVEKA